MQHWQEQYQCSKCKREFIVDITSIGTGHQSIVGITCKECAIRIMKKGKVEELEFKPITESKIE